MDSLFPGQRFRLVSSPPGPWHLPVMWTRLALSPSPERNGAPVQTKSNGPERTQTFAFRLQMEAAKLRKQAEGMPASIRRDELLQKARQADTAQQINPWPTSPFSQP